jgi:hypothetical protein
VVRARAEHAQHEQIERSLQQIGATDSHGMLP